MIFINNKSIKLWTSTSCNYKFNFTNKIYCIQCKNKK